MKKPVCERRGQAELEFWRASCPLAIFINVLKFCSISLYIYEEKVKAFFSHAGVIVLSEN